VTPHILASSPAIKEVRNAAQVFVSKSRRGFGRPALFQALLSSGHAVMESLLE
jgi:hypothetical protein